MKIKTFKGDITKLEVDAIVNAAKTSLLGGGGVDGAIHRAAGPGLLEECKTLGGCKTGEAKITKGYNLPAKYVIHTPGPVYQDGSHDEGVLLASCYTNSLKEAISVGAKTIAFPAISTGIYGFPKEEATLIAVGTVISTLKDNNNSDIEVIFCVFDDEMLDLYNNVLAELFLE